MKYQLANIKNINILPNKKRDLILKFHLDSPHSNQINQAESIKIQGWLVGKNKPAQTIQLVQDNQIITEMPVNNKRPGVFKLFPQVSWAETSGFETQLVIDQNKTESEIILRGVFADKISVDLVSLEVAILNIEDTEDIDNAIKYYEQAILVNPNSLDLYREYFRFVEQRSNIHYGIGKLIKMIGNNQKIQLKKNVYKYLFNVISGRGQKIQLKNFVTHVSLDTAKPRGELSFSEIWQKLNQVEVKNSDFNELTTNFDLDEIEIYFLQDIVNVRYININSLDKTEEQLLNDLQLSPTYLRENAKELADEKTRQNNCKKLL